MEVTGAILAGGKSSRMKYNKAFAKLGNDTIINTILDKFQSLFNQTIIISNEPEQYKDLKVDIYTDIYPGLGPISGIHSALINSRFPLVFVLACDMPFVPETLIKCMIKKINGYDTVVPRTNNFFQATSALYHNSCLPVLTDCLENNKLKTGLIFKELNTNILDENELSGFGNIEEMFFNINDEIALSKAKEIARRLSI